MKKLYTSYFANRETRDLPNRISVAYQCRFFTGPFYYPLAPTPELVGAYKRGEIDWTEYEERYFDLIINQRKLKAEEVVDDLPDGAIMLCYESYKKPPFHCHRRLAAEWIEMETGIVVPEIGMT